MPFRFEHDFQQKIMYQSFEPKFHISSPKDVLLWRSFWMKELKSWHSPYKLVLDCSGLSIEDSPEIKESLSIMFKFYQGLFMKSAVGFCPAPLALQTLLPFEIFATQDEALVKAGLRGGRVVGVAQDFRGAIQFQNHFAQHVIELSFSEVVRIDSKEKMAALKSKLTNNLMQWHSKWSLLVDCTNISFSADILPEWGVFQSFFSRFFMKVCIGYAPSGAKEEYPFSVYRSRHKAVAMLEAEGNFMGDDAHCRSAKSTTK